MDSGTLEQNYFTCTLGEAAHLKQTLSQDDLPDLDLSTIDTFLDFQSRNHGDLPAIAFPHPSHDSQDGNREEIFTFTDLRKGSMIVAEQLHSLAKSDGRTEKCVALLCPSSVDFLFAWLGLMRAGFEVLLIAPQCPAAAIAHLCRSCEVALLLYEASYRELALASAEKDTAQHCVKQLPWQVSGVSLSDFLGTSSSLDLKDDFTATKSEYVAYIHHTSGTTTGLPKPIPQTHRAAIGVLPRLSGGSAATFTTTPLYHGGIADCFRAWTSNALIWLFPAADLPITARNIVSCLSLANRSSSSLPPVKYFSSVPYVLQMLAEDPSGLAWLQRMDIVGVGGAALPTAVGDSLVKQDVNLVSRFGSAECGFLLSSHRLYTTDKDWQYLRVSSKSEYLRFEEVDDGSGRAELVVLKGWPHMAKVNREDGAFATSDVFEKHSQIEGAWKYASRSDGMIALVTGRKFDPVSLEEGIVEACGKGMVDEALVFGKGRVRPGILVLAGPESKRLKETEWRDIVYEGVEKLNARGESWMRIEREMMVVLDANTAPMEKSSKGTVLRGAAEERFVKAIEKAYSIEDTSISRNGTITDGDILGRVRDIVHQTVGIDKSLEDDENFYHRGIDSVKCMQIRALLQQKLVPEQTVLPLNVVFDHGNISRLAQFLVDLKAGKMSCDIKDERQYMLDLVEEYSAFSSEIATCPMRMEAKSSIEYGGRQIVLLTGATGALGAHILHSLRSDPGVSQIICLVRASDAKHARSRISKSLSMRRKDGLYSRDTNIVCLSSNLGEPNLGLMSNVLSELYTNVTTIIHAAWSVNFSLPLHNFVKEHISGIRNLIDVSLSCVNPARFVFCSSTASVLGPTQPRIIAEAISEHPGDADSLGYSKSKWVAEALLARANEIKGREGRIRIARLGQLTGDTENGVWNMSEAFPLIFSTVKELNCLPALDETLSWLPVDIAAQAVIEIARAESVQRCPVYHVVNNSTSPTWDEMLSWLQEIRSQRFEIVQPEKWLDELEELESHPAQALLGLWRAAYGQKKSGEAEAPSPNEKHLFLTEEVEKVAGCMRQVKAMDRELVGRIWRWIESEP